MNGVSKVRLKSVKKWRKTPTYFNKLRSISKQFLPFVDVSDRKNTSFQHDIILPILRVMKDDESI